MKPHDFIIVGGDTDSIMFCKRDQSPFSKEEQSSLINEINGLLPGLIRFANDGVFKRVIYLKAKNYVMVDEKGKWKVKGSALKSSTLEPILKQFINEMVSAVIEIDDTARLVDIYHRYIKLVNNITDIKPWCSKKALSPTTFRSERTNETKIVDALKGTEYRSGDRVYLFPVNENILSLAENFVGVYHKEAFYKKLYKATERFKTILPTKDLFLNYSLKKNKPLLENL